MITIVDYGLGNVGSIANMLRRLGVPTQITRDLNHIRHASKLILPGVGAFDTGMGNLHEFGLIEPLHERVQAGVPILGICLGAQLMTRRSDEGKLSGLSWIDANTIRFFSAQPVAGHKIPHMGWNRISLHNAAPLMCPQEDNRFYFVHSYHFACRHQEDVIATAHYGYEFTAAFRRGNVFGVQFHPEKSHRYGMRLLQRFATV